MQNGGGGPAVNIQFEPLFVGSAKFVCLHSDALQAGEAETVHFGQEGRPPMILMDFVAGAQALVPAEIPILVKYESMSRIRYKTEQTLDLNDRTGGFVVRFERFTKIGPTAEAA